MGDQHQGAVGGHGNRREILDRIEGHGLKSIFLARDKNR
jgi:hypothetical protein